MKLAAWPATVASVIAASVVSLAAPDAAQAQQRFPSRPVRIVVPFSPGSATDISARMIAPRLSERWGQPVIIENRAGAGGTLAAAAVAQATPDGHTLLLVSAAFAIGAVLNSNLPYDPLKDFTGVTQIGTTSGLLAASPALGVKSVKELIALIEIIAGRIHYGFPSMGPALAFIRDGRLVALAVVTTKRTPLLPDVPTMAEVLPGFERDASHALIAPAKTPRPILNQISQDVARVLELPEVKQQMEAMSFEPAPTTPEGYDQILRGLIKTFTRVAQEAGLKPK